MIDYSLPRCPKCYSEVRFEKGASRLIAYCASSGEHGMIHDDILEYVTRVYNETFAPIDGERIDEPILIR